LGVLEIANELLLLRVYGDNGLTYRLRRNDFDVDILELCVAVGMARALIGLAIGLAREAELDQFLAHGVGADRMTYVAQCRRQLVHAFGDPDQRPHRIAQGGRLDKTFELGNKRRIFHADRFAPAARAANPPVGRDCRSLTAHIDFVPTLLSMAGVAPGKVGEMRVRSFRGRTYPRP